MSWDDAFTSVGASRGQKGDEVWVAAARYVERITFKNSIALYSGLAGTEGSSIDLAGRDFQAGETILDGNQAGRASSGQTALCTFYPALDTVPLLFLASTVMLAAVPLGRLPVLAS